MSTVVQVVLVTSRAITSATLHGVATAQLGSANLMSTALGAGQQPRRPLRWDGDLGAGPGGRATGVDAGSPRHPRVGIGVRVGVGVRGGDRRCQLCASTAKCSNRSAGSACPSAQVIAIGRSPSCFTYVTGPAKWNASVGATRTNRKNRHPFVALST